MPLLKILEGTVVNVPPQGGRKHPEQKFIQVDTRNILRVFFHDAFEDVDFFQRRHQRVGTGGLVAQIDKIMSKLIANLENKLGAKLR